MKNESTSTQPSRRDAFAEAKDAFILSLTRHPKANEPIIKLFVTMAVSYANRAHFEATGELMAWPSQETLQKDTGMFRGRIIRALKAAEQLGITVVQRPEKRGATHHNVYVLRTENGLTGETLKGLTTVTNSGQKKGLTSETVVDRKTVSPVGPLTVSPVIHNSLEEPLDDADAHSRPLSDSADVTVADDGHTALDAPMPVAPDPMDPDAWRSLPEFRIAAEKTGARPSGAPAASHQDEDDGGGFERSVEAGADELRRLFPELHTDLRRFMEDVADGLCARDPEALIRLKGCAELMFDPIPLSLRREKLDRLSSVMTAVAAFGGGTAFANRVVSDFLRPYQENCEGVCHE